MKIWIILHVHSTWIIHILIINCGFLELLVVLPSYY